MKRSDIRVGEFYRVKGNEYAYAKVIEVIPPMTSINNTRAYVAKCQWVINKDDKFGMIKYFKISELTKIL